jgi:hypothetical protein
MSIELASLRRRSWRAYRSAQIGRGILAAVPALILIAATSRLGCDPSCWSLVGAALIATTAWMGWKGEPMRSAARPGLFAGAFPALLPLTVECCTADCLTMCLLGSLVAGVVLSLAALRARAERRVGFLIYGGVTAALSGAMGCYVGGLAGLTALAIGLVTICAPVYWATRVERS